MLLDFYEITPGQWSMEESLPHHPVLRAAMIAGHVLIFALFSFLAAASIFR